MNLNEARSQSDFYENRQLSFIFLPFFSFFFFIKILIQSGQVEENNSMF